MPSPRVGARFLVLGYRRGDGFLVAAEVNTHRFTLLVDTAKHLSNRAYAQRMGVSEASVRKWLEEGKIRRHPVTGKIDSVEADALLDGNLSRLPTHGHDSKKISANGNKKVNGKRLSLAEAQTKKVNAEAQLAELKLAEQQENLVDKERMLEFVFKLFRDERDALVAWPGRIGHEFALDIQQKGNEPRVVITLLEKYVKRYLAERAKAERPRSLRTLRRCPRGDFDCDRARTRSHRLPNGLTSTASSRTPVPSLVPGAPNVLRTLKRSWMRCRRRIQQNLWC